VLEKKAIGLTGVRGSDFCATAFLTRPFLLFADRMEEEIFSSFSFLHRKDTVLRQTKGRRVQSGKDTIEREESVGLRTFAAD